MNFDSMAVLGEADTNSVYLGADRTTFLDLSLHVGTYNERENIEFDKMIQENQNA